MTTTLWLTGLPSSGKSTLGRELVARYQGQRAVQHLDGDAIRREFFPELGFAKEDRIENVRRIGRLAAMLAAQDVLVVVSVIAPFRSARAEVRELHERAGLTFVEVHVHAPVEVCAERDVKGLYAKAERGEVPGMTGVSDVYEAPTTPEVRVDTSEYGVDQCLELIDRALRRAEQDSRAVVLR
ncbi:adenylyl-sulfate kinase [Saccharothrix coeruleofusca]|uniref:Adenylyl-sulfate kinase n=1 Tax=Saccharothrix coeruleofusca TaxID=33919 RepID=A0A918EGD4_9PSEU|nr:adenylyl-sulfate kinase [Saccharothrix coeruleofusca]MBP2334916.1 adenylylsulfate kinase [Saccharothrix coeruleofusca]GGP67915.1 adenylyl-sulfate kinase [Saccharothrix coeruleofusca]